MPIIVAVILTLFIAVYLFTKRASRIYGPIYAEPHFRELYTRFLTALDVAKTRQPVSSEELRRSDQSFETSAHVYVAVTFAENEAGEPLKYHCHISLSHAPLTTHAVSERLSFFLVMGILAKNEIGLTPFFTQNRVHHLILQSNIPFTELNDFDTAFRIYSEQYQRIPFIYKELPRPT